MSNFNLSQICKIMLTQNHKVWKFNTNDLFCILRLKNAIESYAACQNIEVQRKVDEVMTKNSFAQTIPDKIFGTKQRKLTKIGQEKNSLVRTFPGLLTAIANFLKGDWRMSKLKLDIYFKYFLIS